MPSFAQVADLQAFTGQTLNTAQAQQVLNQSTGLIQAWTGQNLFQVVNETVTVDPLPNMSVMLPELPVTAVTSFSWLDDKFGTGWNVIPANQYRFKSWGAVYIVPYQGFDTSKWPTDLDTIQVTNTHGYATSPQPVYDVCISLAARLLINPYMLAQTQTGGVRVVYTASMAASALLDTEKTALGRFTVDGWA